jgi:hypothetical protein
MGLASGASAGTAGGVVEVANGHAVAIVDGAVLVVEEGLDEGGMGVEHGVTSR